MGVLNQRTVPLLYLIGGSVGLAAAFTLLVEKIELLKDPSYVPSCSINPILSCGSIMKTDQAEVFGFPNPIIGIISFSILITVGAVLFSRVQLNWWFWIGLQAGTTFGVIFVHWLIFQSLYRIDALCPYCMVVWIVTIPAFWYTTLYNANRFETSLPRFVRAIASGITKYHGAVLTAWYLTIVSLILVQFWDYWSTLLS
jgi:uncharacterized membrane protein